MTDPLENIVRAWADAGSAVLSPSSNPGDLCIDFALAEQIARGRKPQQAELAEHIESCEYCTKLISDFTEALDEGVPVLPARTSRGLIVSRLAALAAAAVILLTAGVAIFFAMRPSEQEPLLASAAVGLQSEIELGLTPKGRPSFRSGDMIMLRIELRGDCFVALLNLDPGGRLIPMLPDRMSPELAVRFKRGRHLFGPYLADDVVGEETIFIITMKSKPKDILKRIADLKEDHARVGDKKIVIDRLKSWPAGVRAVSFDHLPVEE